jgi:hypothetical protein
MLEKRTEVPEELEVIVEKATLVVEEMSELFPALEPGWDRSLRRAETAAAFLGQVHEGYVDLALQALRLGEATELAEPPLVVADIVTSPVRPWVVVMWKGESYYVDFLPDETVITSTDDEQYQEMQAVEWPGE